MSFEEKKKIESKEKDKALSLVLGQIERNFGRGSITVSYTHLTLPTNDQV